MTAPNCWNALQAVKLGNRIPKARKFRAKARRDSCASKPIIPAQQNINVLSKYHGHPRTAARSNRQEISPRNPKREEAGTGAGGTGAATSIPTMVLVWRRMSSANYPRIGCQGLTNRVTVRNGFTGI